MKRILFILLALLVVGCASTKKPEKVPDDDYTDVNKPVSACTPPPAREPLVLPEKPVPPPPDATDEEIEKYYADSVEYIKVRDALKDGRIELLEEYLSEYDEPYVEPQ